MSVTLAIIIVEKRHTNDTIREAGGVELTIAGLIDVLSLENTTIRVGVSHCLLKLIPLNSRGGGI